MARVLDPRKVNQFQIEINGLVAFECQEVNIPTPTIAATEHGEGNYISKTAGMVTVGDVTLKKLRVMASADKWAMDWLNAAQNMSSGSGGLEGDYKKTIVISELSADMKTVKSRWVCYGAWAKEVSFDTFSRTSSDNVMQTVLISVDRLEQV